jgi:hypothetical protein
VRRLQRLGHAWLAGLGPGGAIHEAGVSAGKVGGAARIVLGLLNPRWLQIISYHAAGTGVATGPVKFVVEALRRLDWTWRQVEDWTVCTYACICGGCLGGPAGYCWS